MFDAAILYLQNLKAYFKARGPILAKYGGTALALLGVVWAWDAFIPESGLLAAAAVTTTQALFKATAGVFMVFGTLKFFDSNIDGDSFGQTFKTASPAFKMAYFTGRFVGVCILYGMVLSG
jgi:hypothetical protein